MNGLELSEKFFKEVGLPAFQNQCWDIMDDLCFGLVGQGSECFGFDDEISRDHDWGPGFCIWVPTAMFEQYAGRVQQVYDSLPATFEGYPVKGRSCNGEQRVGVQAAGMFLYQFIGVKGVPADLFSWLRSGEETYATCTNGKIFYGENTPFAKAYAELKKGYPEDIRLKKIAARATKMAQSGQYNYVRCMGRGNKVAAFQSLAEFVKETCSMIHLLNHAYCPFYKWMWRSLEEQPILGKEIAAALLALVAEPYAEGNKDAIEKICIMVKDELKAQGLTDETDNFLTVHGASVMKRIQDPQVRSLPVIYG